MKDPTITFYNGAGIVAGAEFVYETDGVKVLFDCGLIQGVSMGREYNDEDMQYDPKLLTAVCITHSHMDHIGRLPKLVAGGFDGPIYSTQPTRQIAELMLLDELSIMTHAIEKGELSKPLFTINDIRRTMSLWAEIDLHVPTQIAPGLTITPYDAGHILGSAMYLVDDNGTKTLFTGDLGNSPSPLLPDTEIPPSPDYLVTESVYGDRNHEEAENRAKQLEEIIMENYKRKGTLLIPAFSVERTQELLFELDRLVEHKIIPAMPIFVDSPLGISVTQIYKHNPKFLKESVQTEMKSNDIFRFAGLTFTDRSEESKKILHVPEPKVVIASSGMSTGGRILHHERNYLSDPNNTFLVVGYQAPGTLGRKILEGDKKVKIFGDWIEVRAKVQVITGYSGHKDSDNLIEFAGALKANIKKVFCVLGEGGSARYLAQELRDIHELDTEVPKRGQTVTLKRSK